MSSVVLLDDLDDAASATSASPAAALAVSALAISASSLNFKIAREMSPVVLAAGVVNNLSSWSIWQRRQK